jgi:hypothetical protein
MAAKLKINAAPGTPGPLKLESAISVSILFLLIAIATLIYFQQFAYDEEQFNASVMQTGTIDPPTHPNGKMTLEGVAPENFLPMSDPEYFDRDTLSHKINGKADTYLDAGFSELVSGRFVNSPDSNLWFEFFLYNMETPRNAFAVYSTQKREGVPSLDFTRFAYATENAVFFVHGPYYVEIIGAQQNDVLMNSMTKMSDNFINRHPGDRLELAELSYFPEENLDLGSISIILHNGFGFEKFDNLVTGVYDTKGHRITAFLSVRDTPDEAETLAHGYAAFLKDLMGEEGLPPETDHIPGLAIIDVFGEYEMVFAKENILAGIHVSPDKGQGEQVAVLLYQKIIKELK